MRANVMTICLLIGESPPIKYNASSQFGRGRGRGRRKGWPK
jgi:hypothetical protein